MPNKMRNLDIDYIISRHFDEKIAIRVIAKELGCSDTAILARLAATGKKPLSSGVISKANAVRARSQISGDVASQFTQGASVKSLAVKFGRSRSVINACLADHGIKTRCRSDSMYLRMSKTSFEDRKKLTEKANQAIRAKPSSFHKENAEKQAITKAVSLSKVGAGEVEFMNSIKAKGFNPVPQLAVGVYNLDIAVGNLAVEVHANTGHPHTMPRLLRRIKDLLNCGYNVLYIKTLYEPSKCATDWTACADYAVTFIDETSCLPSRACEYRVIRCNGDLIARGRLNGENLAIECPPS